MLLISLQKHVLWVLIRTPRLCTSNKYHHLPFHGEIKRYYVDTYSYLELIKHGILIKNKRNSYTAMLNMSLSRTMKLA